MRCKPVNQANVAAWLLVASICSAPKMVAEEPQHGSITIDRIAEIKYPTGQRWSPDGKTVALLWDAAGKQDLLIVQPGGVPFALTDFPLDPDLLVSDIGHFEWSSPDKLIFSKGNQLWSVSTLTPKPEVIADFQGVSSSCLSSDKRQIAVVQRGDIWVASLEGRTRRRLSHMPDGLVASEPSLSRRKYVAFEASRHEEVAEPLPYNGNLLKVYRSPSRDDRIGVVSTFDYATEPMWINVSARNYGSTAKAQS